MTDIRRAVFQIIQEEIEDKTIQVTDDTALIGDGSVLDSMTLVRLCLKLEDFAEDKGFEFDWTSEKAMSKLGSVFMNVETISTEFIKQYKNKK